MLHVPYGELNLGCKLMRMISTNHIKLLGQAHISVAIYRFSTSDSRHTQKPLSNCFNRVKMCNNASPGTFTVLSAIVFDHFSSLTSQYVTVFRILVPVLPLWHLPCEHQKQPQAELQGQLWSQLSRAHLKLPKGTSKIVKQLRQRMHKPSAAQSALPFSRESSKCTNKPPEAQKH